MSEIAMWPILAAGVASVLIGWVWYHPKVFGSAWMRMSAVTPEQAERGKKMMPLFALIALVGGMLTAWVMSYIALAWGFYDLIGAVELGVWTWLGFVAPTMLGMVLWEHKPLSLYFLNVGYWLVVFIVMAIILVLGSAPSGAYDMQNPGVLSGE